MFILFSPSEEKIKSSNNFSIEEIKNVFYDFDHTVLFVHSSFRKKILKIYADNLDNPEEIFGIKSPEKLLENFSPAKYKAIELYSGVSYKELDFKSLSNSEKQYLENQVLIFSNLFGILKANDEVPFYKLKQGVKLKNLNQAKEYKKDISDFLDKQINDFAIDLRAKIYEEYYEIKAPFYSFEFYKNGKQLSHDSKVYRGKLLRKLAINNINNSSDLFKMISQNYNVFDTKNKNNKTTFCINIKEDS